MPVKRRAEKPRFEFDFAVETHMTVGDCLLGGPGKGCGCGLTDANGDFREELARDLWRMRRREILDQWNKPQMVDWYKRTDPRHGFGPYFPCYAAVVFDAMPWPAFDPKWPESVRNHWGYIQSALEAVARG